MIDSDMTSPYRGLTPYTEVDCTYFFGRTNEIATIAANLAVARLTLFYGPSGVGKTSVLRAGVLYQLQQRAQANCVITDSPEVIPVYFSTWQHVPLVSLTQAITEAIRPYVRLNEQQDTPEFPHSFTAFLRSITKQTSSDLLLILDQFEEYFLYHADESGPGTFADELVQAINSPDLPVNFLLSLREDALARLDRFKGQITFLFDNRLSIDYLGRAAGREAITKPLEQYNQANQAAYAIEPTLVEAVLEQVGRGKVALARQGAGITAAESSAERIETPYLQLVLTRLWTEEQKLHSTILRFQTLTALGGAEQIVANYLNDTMASLAYSQQAIAARFFDHLVTIGGTKIALSLDELNRYAKADPAEVEQVLQQLQAKRLLRGVRSPTGAMQYEIFHDVLAQAILDWQSQVPWRAAERYLDAGLFDWQEAKQRKQAELLLDRNRYLYIWSHKNAFGSLSEGTNEFLLRSALCQGESSFSYWLNCLPEGDQCIIAKLIQDYVLHPDENIRKAAQTAIIQAKRAKQLNPETETQLANRSWKIFQSSTTPTPKEATSAILWSLRPNLAPAHLFQVLLVVLQVWVRTYRAILFTSVGSAAVVILLVISILVIREQTRGIWHRVPQQLFAGPISALALSPHHPDTIYVITPRGPNIEEGATLLRRQGPNAGWEVLSKNFTHSEVRALTVTEIDKQVRFYVSSFNEGIIRSDDQGRNWQTINNGLLSFSIAFLLSDPLKPNILYAGSSQQRGVFESQDGGDTWRDISGDENELFGLSITAMAFTNYEEGAVLVSTAEDGRIWARKRGENKWRPVVTLPGIGSIVTLAVEPQTGKDIYAGTSNGTVLYSENGPNPGWVPVTKIPGVFIISSMAVPPNQPDIVFLSAYGIGGNLVWRSADYGQNWEHVGDADFTREQVKLYVHPQATDSLYAAGQPGLFESSTFGDSWVFAHNVGSPLATIGKIAISPVAGGPTYLVVGGAIYVNPDPNTIAWTRAQNLKALSVNDIVTDPLDANKAYAAVHLPNQWSIMQTVDGGKTWHSTNPPPKIAERYFNDTTSIDMANVKGRSILYAGTNVCGVVYSEDRGENWNAIAGGNCLLDNNAPRNILDLAASPASTSTVYVAAERAKVYRSADKGKTWKWTELKIAGQIGSIRADPNILDRVYLIAGSDGFWRSDDGAETWQSYSTDFKEKSLVALAVVSQKSETLVFVASNDGAVWTTADGGKHWTSIRENLATTEISSLAYDERQKQLLLGSWQHGLYKFQPGSIANIWR